MRRHRQGPRNGTPQSANSFEIDVDAQYNRRKKAVTDSDDEMDVDGEDQEDDADDADGDVAMADGDEGAEAPKRKKSKKGRKSELNMEALTNEAAAMAALEGNQMLHLKLRRKYYSEALNFIRQLEAGMKIVEQLLASTNKPEVLEAMEFFRVAYEYQFDGAEVHF